ncbi:MAG: SDR family oxidoreductase [Bacteroidia bacterium]
MSGAFQGKVAIITGSSSGIGKTTALQFARQGASVVINGRSKDKLDELRATMEEEGLSVLAIAADITAYKECERLIAETVKHFGGVDILINNASLTMNDTFENIHPDTFNQVLLSNTLGAMMPTKAALSQLKQSKGSVVFISSLAGLHGLPAGSAYCAGKMALTGFWQSLRIELDHTGIHFGICYVSFTQNDKDKRMLAGAGELVEVDERPALLKQSQEQVASAIVRCVRKRKAKVVLSRFGKFISVMFRYMPRITLFLVTLINNRRIAT